MTKDATLAAMWGFTVGVIGTATAAIWYWLYWD